MPVSILRGRPWPQPGEPLFLPEDYDLAMEAEAERRLRCSGCGHPRDESMDPARDLPPGMGGVGEYETHDVVCQACAAKARRERALTEAGGKSDLDGRYIVTEFVPYDESELAE